MFYLNDNIIKDDSGLIFYPNSFRPLLSSEEENDIQNEGFLYSKPQDFTSFLPEEKRTDIWTNESLINIKQTKKNKEIVESKIFKFEEIKQLLETSNKFDFSKIIPKFIKDKNIEKAEKNFTLIKRKRKRRKHNLSDKQIKDENKIEILVPDDSKIEIYKPGRKKKDDPTRRNHNRFTDDNIIKKIKSKYFEKIIEFGNNILHNYFNNDEDKDKICLKYLSYQYINKMKKDDDIKFLEMPLKEIYSLDISPRYSKFSSDANKQLIDSVKKNDDEIIQFVFNLKFKEWINLFTLKKYVRDFVENEPIANEIESNMPKIIDLLTEIMDEEKKNKDNYAYFSNFLFYLFNYEAWFLNKRGRKTCTKNKI